MDSDSEIKADIDNETNNDEAETKKTEFDLYASYEVNKELLESSKPMIQIGDTVLYLNKATVQDFIDAGAGVSKDTTIKNELNRKREQSGGVALYLGDDISLEGYFNVDGEEMLEKDVVISMITVQYLQNTDIPDLHSIYFTGGARFSGSIDDAVNQLGEPTEDFEGDSTVPGHEGVKIREVSYRVGGEPGDEAMVFRSVGGKINRVSMHNNGD